LWRNLKEEINSSGNCSESYNNIVVDLDSSYFWNHTNDEKKVKEKEELKMTSKDDYYIEELEASGYFMN
jgi:hypothetical protein